MSRKRQPKETIPHSEMLNEEEQEQMIKDFQKQDTAFNFLYRVLFTFVSLTLAAYFVSLTSVPRHNKIGLGICTCSVLLNPVFVLLVNEERYNSKEFWFAYAAAVSFSVLPLVMNGLEGVWAVPLMTALVNGFVIRDMHSVQAKIKDLKTKKYKLKGA